MIYKVELTLLSPKLKLWTPSSLLQNKRVIDANLLLFSKGFAELHL